MASASNGNDEKVAETVIVGRYIEMERDDEERTVKSKLSSFLWHGGSTYDAWFSCASNQVETCFLHILVLLHSFAFRFFWN